jgi:CheY-like chemotaxis protein
VDSLAELLRMDGHDVAVVHNGQEALAAFSAFQPGVSLLDISMPELNGYEVARRVRQGSLGRAITLIAGLVGAGIGIRPNHWQRDSIITSQNQSRQIAFLKCSARMDSATKSRAQRHGMYVLSGRTREVLDRLPKASSSAARRSNWLPTQRRSEPRHFKVSISRLADLLASDERPTREPSRA